MKNGFTLVELSIVLVIVGLLIGGILIGQTLIDSARINSLIRQIQQYDIAVVNFKDKYKGIPGDLKNIFPNGGDGDGRLEDSTIQANTQLYALYFDYELAGFWNHLSLSGFQPEGVTYSRVATSGIRPKVQIPQATFGKGTNGNSAFLAYNQINAPFANYWIGDFNSTTNTSFNTPAAYKFPYTNLEMIAIDSKFDDGKPGTGIVTAYNPTPNLCYTGAVYNSNTNKECILFVGIASQIGGLRN